MDSLSLLKICSVSKLTDAQLKYAKYFVPELRTRKNKFGADENGQFHVCYCIVNLINSKCYFGKHTFNYDPKIKKFSNYYGSSTYLHNSMHKYGIQNSRMLILKYFKTPELALAYEVKLITLGMIQSDNCYNRQGGGSAFATGKFHHIHKKVQDGTNPFQRRPDGSSVTKDRNLLLAKLGKHQWQKKPDGSSFMLGMTKLGKNPLSKRKDGSSVTLDRIKKGNHPWLGIKPWEQNCATQQSLLTWFLARKIRKLSKEYPSARGWEIRNRLEQIFRFKDTRVSPEAINRMLKKFKNGWIPTKDESWVSFNGESRGFVNLYH